MTGISKPSAVAKGEAARRRERETAARLRETGTIESTRRQSLGRLAAKMIVPQNAAAGVIRALRQRLPCDRLLSTLCFRSLSCLLCPIVCYRSCYVPAFFRTPFSSAIRVVPSAVIGPGYPVVCSDPNRSQSCGREAGILFVFILWRDNGLKTGARLRHRLGGAPASQSSSMSTLRMHRVESWSAPRGQGWPHWAAARV